MLGREIKKEIVDRLNTLGLRLGHEAAFRDWCECVALAIANGCDLLRGKKWEAREARYKDIMAKYEPAEQDDLKTMFASLVAYLEKDPFQDALGQLYMELFASRQKSKTLGQCFTPMSVASACAYTTVGEITDETLAKYTIADPLTVNDCAVGGGVMLIAFLKALQERGFDWQHKCKVVCNDLDRLCVHMSYIQLSLIGARAVVRHQDTMTQDVFDEFRSPMELLWPMTLEPLVACERVAQTPSETAQICPTLNETHQDVQTPTEPQKPLKTANKTSKQLSLF